MTEFRVAQRISLFPAGRRRPQVLRAFAPLAVAAGLAVFAMPVSLPAWGADAPRGAGTGGVTRVERDVPAAASATAAPAPAAPPVQAARVNLSARVNAALDNAAAFAFRVAETPMALVLLLTAAGLLVILLAAARLLRGRPSHRHLPLLCVAAAAAFGFTVMEWRLTVVGRRIGDLQNRLAEQQAALQAAVDARNRGPRHLLFDREAAEKALRAGFGEVRIVPSVYNEAADLVLIRLAAGPVHAFLAVVDLTHTGLAIRLDPAIGAKTLTSAFARTNGCMLAVNGEAGNSPALDSGFGEWIGNFVSAGTPLLLKDTAKRPFLVFDRRNRASYAPARVVDAAARPEWHNVIWGRHDALVDGKVSEAADGDRQPRTAMGIDAAGARLYLLVADGRQGGYSAGLSRRAVGLMLAAFGASDGMLCDEGGSSCMVAPQAGGVINSPSDGGGKERPTYTHFGVALAPAPPPQPDR